MRSTENKVTEKTGRCMTETDKYGQFVRRIMRAYGNRVADLDIEGLKGLVDLRAELDAEIAKAVAQLQDRPKGKGYSWADIGRVLGITRQAAQQRFGRR
ncbi:hypothetical protein JOF56_003724 [Kibdelosporangium banguiense]|uniref:Uncharacterized protein n=1 Tax=Kibdelosporangium banguiense TaxID=1365924 RepID=A0ABS4TFZ1_9PSEU|nr:hypothetical protein [Kibdelosporangium banguiense]MBP2323339.1 hypothetical protein [Kibdelosporangium banguiense]